MGLLGLVDAGVIRINDGTHAQAFLRDSGHLSSNFYFCGMLSLEVGLIQLGRWLLLEDAFVYKVIGNLTEGDYGGLVFVDGQEWLLAFDLKLPGAFAGDHDAALDKLEAAIAAGARIPTWEYASEFQAVQQNSRFIALRERNLAAINVEREELGWDPVPQVGIFYIPESD